MTDQEYTISEVPPEIIALVFSLFMKDLSRTIYALDYVEKREDITAENFLIHLEQGIHHSKDQLASHGLRVEQYSAIVQTLRRMLFETDIHRLKWPSQDDLD